MKALKTHQITPTRRFKTTHTVIMYILSLTHAHKVDTPASPFLPPCLYNEGSHSNSSPHKYIHTTVPYKKVIGDDTSIHSPISAAHPSQSKEEGNRGNQNAHRWLSQSPSNQAHQKTSPKIIHTKKTYVYFFPFRKSRSAMTRGTSRPLYSTVRQPVRRSQSVECRRHFSLC